MNLTLPAGRSILKPASSSAENPTMTVSAALNVPPIITLPLTVSRYRLRFIAQEPLRLPAYAGSTWRGAFGHALKRLVCVTREPHCPDCLLYRSCSYPWTRSLWRMSDCTGATGIATLHASAIPCRWADWLARSNSTERDWNPSGPGCGSANGHMPARALSWDWAGIGSTEHAITI